MAHPADNGMRQQTIVAEADHAQADCMPFRHAAPVSGGLSPVLQPAPMAVLCAVLLALVDCQGRSTLTGFLRRAAEATSLCGPSRFPSRWS